MSRITPKPGMTVEISMQGIEKSRLDAIEEAESLRKANEVERADAELMRKEAEAGRITAEQDRALEEYARELAENGRMLAEESRVNAENQRAADEQSRVDAEKGRSVAEANRANAENQRVAAEKLRANAEDARATAEGARANAEALRQQTFETNETNRQADFDSAETQRASEWTEIKSDVESSVGSAVAAASAATDAANTAAENANAIVPKLCTPFEASGSVVTCHPVEHYPLGVVSRIDAVQEGSGDPSPDNVRPIVGWDAVNVNRCGKNLLDLSNAYAVGYNIAGLYNFLQPNTTYTFTVKKSHGIGFGLFLMDSMIPGGTTMEKNLTNGYIAEGSVKTFTTPADISMYPYIILAGSKYGIIDYYPDVEFQLELGSTATAYEPYQGDAYTADFGQTVYGGTLDWNTGVLTATHGQIAAYAGEGLPGAWISDRDAYAAGAMPTTGAQVVYKLATPQTIQLTPQQILAISGTNTLYTDSGDTTVSGPTDPVWLTQQMMDRIAALESVALSE